MLLDMLGRERLTTIGAGLIHQRVQPYKYKQDAVAFFYPKDKKKKNYLNPLKE